MTKARATSTKARRTKRKKSAVRAEAKTKRSAAAKSRRKSRPKGIASKLARAVQAVADTMQETSEMRREAAKRGLIDEG